MSLSCFRINTYTSVDSKGLTAMRDFGALARYRPRSPLPFETQGKAESGRYKTGATKLTKLMQKENAATWLPRRRLYLVVPEVIIAKFGLGSRKKEEREKITQRH